ncbi:RNA binding protein [Oryctes borbonicus]|uniref:CCR4-NOT transcription complex subunit 4 n=1 Tax=Oryctes borbonicus TaxID=1629725 RepID=A0A0T6B7H4_9SCAR|nr:RNA binding protein [Oryctes borbonicus]
MSVLNQSGEEQVECPLCMEPLEVDDLNFFPCTCGYQICRFCWHRIRTDENGLCPACRKAYSENPADFTPLSKEQVAQLKAEKRQRDQQRKAKLSESRKHLASVRVVQRNLVFVVGLPLRLADPEILKRHEYFGKFGRIHKVVINQSTAYAGSQGPSASAYVTYMKSDDALRAIQSVNNVTLDGRQIKSSLGTTKYCSHFMKNQPCPKPDCMYLHDFGDPEASFTKEQMHAGKHQEYEKKLHEALQSRLAAQTKQDQQQTTSAQESNSAKHQTVSKSKESPGSTTSSSSSSTSSSSSSSSGGSTTNGNSNNNNNNNSKETWPQLNSEKEKNETATSGKKTEKEKEKSRRGNKTKSCTNTNGSSNCNNNNNNNITSDNCKRIEKQQQKTSILITSENQKISGDNSSSNNSTSNSRMICREQNCIVVSEMSRRESESSSTEVSAAGAPPLLLSSSSSMLPKLPLLDDNSSFFSQNTFHKISPSEAHAHQQSAAGDDELSADGGHGTAQVLLNDSLPDINSCEDWEAAFGFSKHGNHLEELANTKDAFGSCYGALGMDGPYIDGFSGGNGYDFKNVGTASYMGHLHEFASVILQWPRMNVRFFS